MPDEYAQQASVYDAIYTIMKDYAKEAERVKELIRAHSRVDSDAYGHDYRYRLLDVACGTGLHDQYLSQWFDVEGLDYSPAMLEVARQRLPQVKFHQADMSDFRLGKQFDAVTCLFSAIGHMTTTERMQAAIRCMANHLKPGGVLIVEPFVDPSDWVRGRVSADLAEEAKVARVTKSLLNGHVASLEMMYFSEWDEEAGTARFFRVHHEVGMYTRDEFTAAFHDAGLDISFDADGLMGRGLYIGVNNS